MNEKLIISSGFLPPNPVRSAEHQPHSIALPYPAIEALPEYVCTIDSRALQPAARRFNGSMCRHGDGIFMAYRAEQFDAISKIGICELDSDFRVLRDAVAPIPEQVSVHYEDPRLASIGGRLILQFAHVRFGVPPLCKQRMVTLDPDDFSVIEEIPIPFGGHGIEKNWSPFELPNGNIGLVYSQKKRLIIDVVTSAGAWSNRAPMVPPNSTLSGRTPPLRINNDFYLEFVGGHMPCQPRNARYWFGAQLFHAEHPFAVATFSGPLVWGTEASMTLFSPRPFGGHPLCIFPSGAMLAGEDVLVSCGVNDSYIAILKFNLNALIAPMMPVVEGESA